MMARLARTCSSGVGSRWRLRSSPPIVVRAANPVRLREAIARTISERCKLR
jgi:hypothetical protein